MTIGVVGAGQLGAMLALAGYPLGFDFLFLDGGERTPAGRFAPVLRHDFADPAALRTLAEQCEVISFDWENVSVQALRAATRSTRISSSWSTRTARPPRRRCTCPTRPPERFSSA